MKEKLRMWIMDWLSIRYISHRVETLETLLLHRESKMNGFAVLKKHLNRPDKPLPNFLGKPIDQD